MTVTRHVVLPDVVIGEEGAAVQVGLRARFPQEATIVSITVGQQFAKKTDACTGTPIAPESTSSCNLSVAFRPERPGRARSFISLTLRHLCTNDAGVCEPPGKFDQTKNFRRLETSAGAVLEWTTFGNVELISRGVAAPETPGATERSVEPERSAELERPPGSERSDEAQRSAAPEPSGSVAEVPGTRKVTGPEGVTESR